MTTHAAALTTGQTLVYDRMGTPGAVPVLLIHGLSGYRQTYVAVVDHLIRKSPLAGRCEVFSIDLRGHGESTHADLQHYSADDYTDDVEAFISSVIGASPIVAGHSLGGVVAARLAQRSPHLTAGVFLEDPPLFEGDDARRAASPVASFFTQMVAAVRSLQSQGAGPDSYEPIAQPMTHPDQMAYRCAALQRWDPATMEAAVEGIIWRGFEPLTPITVPVTALRADPAYGAVFLPDDGTRFAGANPHARVVQVDGATHGIHDTPTLAPYLRELDRFVEPLAR